MTIKDIARLSQVSVSTVSRVLNNHPDVSEEVRKKVMKVVNENNYIPSNSARELVKTNSKNIGLIVRGISNPFYTKIITQIESKIESAGYTMVMQQINAGDDEIMAGAIMERDKKLQGLIFLGGKFNYSKEQISAINVPFVCCTYNNNYGSLGKRDYSSVGIDDNEAAYEAVEKLVKAGHKKIAVLLSKPEDGSVSQMRYEGYERALKNFKIKKNNKLIIQVNSYNIKDAYEVTKKWLKEKNDFSAIFAISDNLALGAMKALREAKINVPTDCSIIAIDGIEVSEYMNPVLTTLCQPMEEMGEKSVKILTDIIEKKGSHKQIVLPTIFREGDTL